MDRQDAAVCCRFVCDRYPACRRARGGGCGGRADEDIRPYVAVG